ncbi:unnamed protein product [Mycena citricolor]|uniref:Cyclin N-terminal domain-containing protein n=1 Tax=Mycena citricolor TaxID=2018698 RepID=A0AAD2JY92_9AGAR|nr:unnamed protein product [Mycena citricolor]CAK5269242.1 unnamed protein product [Mycena citricolor]
MASTNIRMPTRTRPVPRTKADENATSRHARQSSGIAPSGASRFTAKDIMARLPAAHSRTVLSEVTTTAVNRKDALGKSVAGTDKDKLETGMKRLRSNSAAIAVAQRVPLGPGRTQPPVNHATNTRPPSRVPRQPLPERKSTRAQVPPVAIDDDDHVDQLENAEADAMQMEVEYEPIAAQNAAAADDENEEHAEDMAVVEEEDVQDELEDDDDDDLDEAIALAPVEPRQWPDITPERALQYRKEVQAVRDTFQDDVDIYDTTMVSEYAEDIFEYMSDLEEKMMPASNYMDHQNEITWAMRQTLVDWLLQVHLRYHMLPETLWIAVNIVDRFLTQRTVSLIKLQLVGVTAMFIAAKYEEILAPSVEEFVFMTENGYSKEEILKGERIMLQTLEFRVSHYCSPYSWMRKISKADDYDRQTRTLSKFLTEVTLLDHRFLCAKPSLIAAVGMYSARRMLDGDWNEAFVFYSGYTEEELIPGHDMLVDKLAERNFSRQYVCRKYAHKKFLKAASFAIEWAKAQPNGGSVERMMLEE